MTTCYFLSGFRPCWRKGMLEGTTVCRSYSAPRDTQAGGKASSSTSQACLRTCSPGAKALFRSALLIACFYNLTAPHCAQAASQNVELHLCRNESSIEAKIEHCTNVLEENNYSNSNWALVTSHNTRGLAFMASGRYEDAIAEFDFVISHGPQLAGYYDNRQNAYRQSSMFDQALADADKAIQFAPRESVIAHPLLILRDRCGELTQRLERGGARAANLNPRVHVRRTRPFVALA